ncbi:MAG: aldo/keto reductase [Bacteroidales bacterium]|nr:aldo/keto reductase [Bacteroidales bacterium]
MEKKQLGTSGFYLTRLTFGAWAIGGWLWGGADKDLAIKAIQKAIDLGMTSIDTAPAYGFGQSEELIGEAVRGKRDQVQLLTKYGLRWDTKKGVFFFDSKDNQGKAVAMHRYAGRESIIHECEQSLKRLKTDYIDLYQIHWHDKSTPAQETMEAIRSLINSGKVRHAGVCNYNTEQLDEALKHIALCSDQVPYSMVKRDIESELVPYCIKQNIGILAYSPLQRGILTGKVTQGYNFNAGDSRVDTPYYQPENISRINRFLATIKPIADDRGITLSQLVINWTLQQPGIASALVGARSPEQVEENAKAVDFMLTDEELKSINHHLNHLELVL